MKKERTQSWIYKCLTEPHENEGCKGLIQEDIIDLSHELLFDLKSIFGYFVQTFNELKEFPIENQNLDVQKLHQDKIKSSILIYDLTDEQGFMLFKQGYKLIFSYYKPGHIKVKFLKHKAFSDEDIFTEASIIAVTNNTMSLNWVHDNHKGFVDINVLARYYMRRFLQES